jgi:hypothetical protein
MSEASRIWRIGHGIARKNAEPEQWEGALKKAIERAGQKSARKFSTLIFKKERGAKASRNFFRPKEHRRGP